MSSTPAATPNGPHRRQRPETAKYANFAQQNWEEEMAAGPCYPIKKAWEQLEVSLPDPG